MIVGEHMASLKKTGFNYSGAGAKHFSAQHKVMESVRDSANITEVNIDDVSPQSPNAQIFGGANTHYSNGNQPLKVVDAGGIANSHLQQNAGTMPNPLERSQSAYDIVAPTRASPIPVSLVPAMPMPVQPLTPKNSKPLLHKDGRTRSTGVF
jgi:hypothetical protein